MKNRESNLSAKSMVLNTIIVVLVFLLLIVGGVAIGEISDNFGTYKLDEGSFSYPLNRESYGEMLRNYYQNCEAGEEDNRSLQEYYGVAKYYEAAFFYRLYEESGDTERAEKQRELMEDAEAQMGDFAFVAENIKEKLQIAE